MIEGDLVVHEVELAAPLEEVFQMFVDPAQLIRWIGRAAELEPRPGGRFRFEIEPGSTARANTWSSTRHMPSR